MHPRDDVVVGCEPRFAVRRRRRRRRVRAGDRGGRPESSRFAYAAEVNFRVDSGLVARPLAESSLRHETRYSV